MKGLFVHGVIFISWGFLVSQLIYPPVFLQYRNSPPDELKKIVLFEEKWLCVRYHDEKMAYLYLKPDHQRVPNGPKLHYFEFLGGITFEGLEYKINGKGYILFDADAHLARIRLDLNYYGESLNILVSPKETILHAVFTASGGEPFKMDLPYPDKFSRAIKNIVNLESIVGLSGIKIEEYPGALKWEDVTLEYPIIALDKNMIEILRGGKGRDSDQRT